MKALLLLACLLAVALPPAWAGPAAGQAPVPRAEQPWQAPTAPPPGRPPGTPSGPIAPPPDRLPAPLSEEQRLEFDRLRTRGILLHRAGRFAEAEIAFRAALAIRPDDTITKAWLRAARQAQGKSPD